MSRLNVSGTSTVDGGAPQASDGKPVVAESVPPNGQGAAPDGAHESAQAEPSRLERAEKMADNVAVHIAMWTSALGRGLIRLGAHAREAVEDIWAEAQNLRHDKQKSGDK
jgi:hypothetical protein